jgi:V/A-type H+/Na+-transporting ATPase subunit C
LFDQRLYSELLAKANLDDLLASLAQSSYGDAFRAALSRHAGWDALRDGLRRDLAWALLKVRAMTTDEPDSEPAQLVSTLLMRWDRRNLLTVLRMQGLGPETAPASDLLIPAGDLDEVTLDELGRQPTLRDAVDLAGAWGLPYSAALRGAWPRLVETGNLAALESAVDLRYARLVAERLDALSASVSVSLVRRVFGWEFDVVNLLNALRLRSVRQLVDFPGLASPVWYMPPPQATGGGYEDLGSTLSEDVLMAVMAAPEASQAHAILADAPGAAPWSPALAEWVNHGSLTILQKALERHLAEMVIAFFRRDPLTVAPIIAYLWAKENEVRNLRLIGVAVAYDLPREMAAADMVVPW